MWDTDPWMEQEAMENERMEADFEQAEMEAAGNAIYAARKAGKCCHTSTVGYINPPVYPEQEGLKPGQSRCTEGCGEVFESDQDWYDAMDEAVGR